MMHICETMRDYIDAMNTSMQGDTIFCSEQLWNEIMKSRPERSKREDPEMGCGALDSMET